MQKRGILARYIVLLLPLLLVGCEYSSSRSTDSSVPHSGPPPIIWNIQDHQTSVQNTESSFFLKFIVINPKEFHFFYAFQTRHQDNLHVVASSHLENASKATISLNSTVQVLGRLAGYEIGVIHVSRVSRPDQIITLQNALPGTNNSSWHLTPLKQLREEPHQDTEQTSMPINSGEHSDIDLYGPVMKQQVGYFKATSQKQSPSNAPYIFVRMDDPIVVSVISQTEYLSIAGPINFTP